MTISELITELTKLQNTWGDLEVVDIDWGHEDYPQVNIHFIKPHIVSHPIETNTNKKLLIFD